jgi:hypothetical protein
MSTTNGWLLALLGASFRFKSLSIVFHLKANEQRRHAGPMTPDMAQEGLPALAGTSG